jgi:hypothetical protein
MPVDSSHRGRRWWQTAPHEHHQHCFVLVGAFDSVREDLRCHGTCAPAAMAGSVACTAVMGDGWTDSEGASSTGAWDGRVAWPAMGRVVVGHGVAADEHAVGEAA